MASPPPPQSPAPTTPTPATNPEPPVLNPPPVNRPRQPEGDGVGYPKAPTYPPTNENIFEALTYSNDITLNRNTDRNVVRCNEDDVVEAAKYQHAILGQASAESQPLAVAPPWFNGAMDALKKDFSSNIEKQTKEMKVMQHELNQSIKSLGIKLDRVETRLEQDIKDVREDVQADLRNLKNEIIPDLKALLNRARGGHVRLERVPFPDGKDPITEGLPELESIHAINHLSEEDTVTYLTRYGVTELPARQTAHLTQIARMDLLRALVGALAP